MAANKIKLNNSARLSEKENKLLINTFQQGARKIVSLACFRDLFKTPKSLEDVVCKRNNREANIVVLTLNNLSGLYIQTN